MRKEEIRAVAALPYEWEKLNGKTVLISGGTGFLGQFLLDVLRCRNVEYGQNIRMISLSRHANEGERAGVLYLRRDVCDPIEVDGQVDYILHLASNTHPKQYESQPVDTITGNVFGCYRLLELAREKGSRFLLASSVEIYGEGNGAPMSESYSGYIDCNTYRAGYNEAKRLSESLCQSYKKQYGTDFVIARLARCFGCDETKTDSKAIAQFFRNAASGEDIVLKSTGGQRFSYCYVADAVSALVKILLNGQAGEAYNVAADEDGKTLKDYAQYIAALAGVGFRIEVQTVAGASKAAYAVMATDKLKALGWTPIYTSEEGMERTYRQMKLRKE